MIRHVTSGELPSCSWMRGSAAILRDGMRAGGGAVRCRPVRPSTARSPARVAQAAAPRIEYAGRPLAEVLRDLGALGLTVLFTDEVVQTRDDRARRAGVERSAPRARRDPGAARADRARGSGRRSGGGGEGADAPERSASIRGEVLALGGWIRASSEARLRRAWASASSTPRPTTPDASRSTACRPGATRWRRARKGSCRSESRSRSRRGSRAAWSSTCTRSRSSRKRSWCGRAGCRCSRSGRRRRSR